MDFDYSYNGIIFEMEITFHDDADDQDWTDVEFGNIVGDIKSIESDGQSVMNQLDIDDLTVPTQEKIRRQAFDYFQGMQDFNSAMDKADADYHAMKEDSQMEKENKYLKPFTKRIIDSGGQLEIYESKECANNQLTYKGMKIVEIEVFMAKEL